MSRSLAAVSTRSGLLVALVVIVVSVSTRCERSESLQETPSIPSPALDRLSSEARRLVEARRDSLAATLRDRESSSEMRAERFAALGKIYLAADLSGAAEECFGFAIELEPTRSDWLAWLAHTQRIGGKIASAVESFEQLATQRNDDSSALIWLGRLHLQLDRRDLARDLFERALALRPDSASAHFGLGSVAAAESRHGDAVRHLEAALAIAPDATAIQYALGQAYAAMGDEEAARRHLTLRGTVEPAPHDRVLLELEALLPDPSLLAERGLRALDEGRHGESIELLKSAVAAAPKNASMRVNLGFAYARLGQSDAARREFLRVLEDHPRDARALVNLGALEAARQRYGDALRYFTDAVAADPEFSLARLALADALQHRGRYDEALPHFEAAVGLDSENSTARLGHALTLARLERWDEARAALERAERKSDDRRIRHALARIYAGCPIAALRDGRRAQELIATEYESAPSMASAQVLAMAFAEMGEFAGAARLQLEAMQRAAREGRPRLIPRLQEQLDAYEAGELAPVFWTDETN